MRQRRLEINGTAAWLLFSLLVAVLAVGCHGDSGQGGGPDQGHAQPSGTPQVQQPHVPTPPTADQIDPSSPRAVLNGTSTTQTTQGKSGATGQSRPATPPSHSPQ